MVSHTTIRMWSLYCQITIMWTLQFGSCLFQSYLFSPSKLSVIGITVSLKSSQYQTQRLTQQKQIISCSVIRIKFTIFPEESLMFTSLYFPLCCLHVSLQSNSEQFISLITAHSPREENKPVHEKAARTQVSVLPPSLSLSVSVKD